MRRVFGPFVVLALLPLLLVVACGEQAEAEPEPVVIPSGPPARDSMSSGSLAGIAPEEIALALPWSSGTLNRGVQPGQAQRTIEDVLVLSGEGFDRLVITFRDDAPLLPGYHLQFVDAASSCVGDADAPSFEPRGAALLELEVSAANASRDDGSYAIPNRSIGAVSDHLLGVYATCDVGGEITWVFDVGEQTAHRLLELVNPTRLVVDVRKPMAADASE